MAKNILILIHGVGDSIPGAILTECSRGLHTRGVAGWRADLEINGVQFPRMTIQHPKFEEIIELNWSDIAKPRRSIFGLLDYWARILVAMLDVAGTPRLTFGRLYSRCFEALLVYCISFPIVTFFWMMVPGRRASYIAIGAIGTAIIGGVTWFLSRFKGAFWFGWIWAISLAIATAALLSNLFALQTAVRVAAIIYVSSQAVTGTLLFCALLQVICRHAVTLDRRIARMALLYFPFFIISAIGALIWVVTLGGVSWVADYSADRLKEWQSLYSDTLSSLGYDLALMEFTFAALVSLVAIGVLGVVTIYLYRARTRATTPNNNAGQFARNAVKWVLAAGAIVFATLTIVYVLSAVVGFQSERSAAVLQVYSISSLRIVPYLPFMVGPLAVVAGIIVDVLFYVVSSDSIVSTGNILRQRLEAIIEYARSGKDGGIIVAAHSQGSVIAVDVLGRDTASASADREGRPICLITAGSPVSSLYKRFLGSTAETRATLDERTYCQPSRWLNISREGDYIGASQEQLGVQEINLGLGGHRGYWRSNDFWEVVRDCA